jgi:2-phosphosulfolactate phosphatase
MEIRRLSLAAGAEAARGLAVIIDVFRAFTTAPLMIHLGARQLLLEADIGRCLALKNDPPGDPAILVGERNEMPIDGFDLTNSPSLVLAAGRALFAGRRVVHRTTSGVTGALTALSRCDEVLLAGYATAGAVAAHILARRPDVVSLVAMGIRSQAKAPEDERCGDYLESLLTGRAYDHVAALAEILGHETAQKFLRGDKAYLPREDPAICLQRDLFDFALQARRSGNLVVATAISPGR